MEAREIAQEIATSPKIATGVASLTAGTGLGTLFEYIPDDIGKLATMVGICLSIVLIRNHLRVGHKLNLEIALLERKEAERQRVAAQRRDEGQPTRRLDDEAK